MHRVTCVLSCSDIEGSFVMFLSAMSVASSELFRELSDLSGWCYRCEVQGASDGFPKLVPIPVRLLVGWPADELLKFFNHLGVLGVNHLVLSWYFRLCSL